MAAKKKTTKKRQPKTPKVAGTPRTHRAIDAGELRESVKNRAIATGKDGDGG